MLLLLHYLETSALVPSDRFLDGGTCLDLSDDSYLQGNMCYTKRKLDRLGCQALSLKGYRLLTARLD